MVIASLPPHPKSKPDCEHSVKERPNRAVLLLKIEFNHLRRLFRRGFELPFLDRLLTRLDENRVSAQGARRLHAAIGGDDDFDFDFAGDVHPASELRNHWRDFCFNLALAFFNGRLLCERQRDGEQSRSGDGEQFLAPSECHLSHTLLRWESTPR